MFKNSPRAKQRTFWKNIVSYGKEYCLETSIHGFNHIAEPRRHWVERLLWIGILCVAVWSMLAISLGQLQRYQDNPTVVTLEKDFRTWSFSLPGVTACNSDRVDPNKLIQAIRTRWNISPENERFPYYERFVSTVANSDLFHLEGYEKFTDDPTLNVDLKDLVVDVMADNQVKIFSSLALNAKWVPVMTEAGICFTTNSLAVADIALIKSVNYTGLPYTCKYSSMNCWIMFEVASNNVDFYVHSPYDVADTSAAASRVSLSLVRVTSLLVMESRAGAGVRALQSRRRNCLYTNEPTHTNRKVYSTNTCRLACRSRLAKQLCGCVPFYYFYEDGPSCSPSGMHCLAGQASKVAGVVCVCNQQCVDALFRELATDDQLWGSNVVFASKGSIRYVVQAPRARYTREIVFHFQDLVVSFGGAAGLFLGASFISFVEILYFVVLRCLRLFAVEDPEPIKIQEKKSRIPFETTRIQEITSILHDENIIYKYDFK